jgi:hypothetical protein
MRAVGIFTVFSEFRDIEKFGALQNTLRTAAMASLNEGWRLSYHAADLGRRPAAILGSATQSVIPILIDQRL